MSLLVFPLPSFTVTAHVFFLITTFIINHSAFFFLWHLVEIKFKYHVFFLSSCCVHCPCPFCPCCNQQARTVHNPHPRRHDTAVIKWCFCLSGSSAHVGPGPCSSVWLLKVPLNTVLFTAKSGCLRSRLFLWHCVSRTPNFYSPHMHDL